MNNRNKLYILISLVVVTVLPRLAFVLLSPDADFAPDVKGYYLVTADSLLEGRGFRAATGGALHYVAPLYAAYLAFAKLTFGGGYRAICFAVFLLNVLTCFVLYSAARRVFDKRIAFGSALAFALYPPLVRLFGRCSADNLLLLLVSLTVYYLVRTFQNTGLKYPILCGVFCGLAALTKPVTLLFPAFLVPWFLILDRKRIKKGIVNSLAVIVAMLIIVTPWIIRQYIIFHKLMPITNQGKVTLQNRADHVLHSERLTKYDRELGIKRYHRSTSQAVGIFLKSALRHPLGYLKSILISVPHLYFRLSSRRFVPALFLMQAAVLGFALVGMFRYFVIARGKRALPLLMVIAYFLFFHSTLAGANVRYGMQTIPFLLMFGVYEIFYIIRGKEVKSE